jgi:hypothetical protein
VFSVVPTVLGNVVPKHEQQISKNNDKKLHAPDVNSLPYICRNAQERKKITSPALYGNEIPKSGIYKCPPGLDIVKHISKPQNLNNSQHSKYSINVLSNVFSDTTFSLIF